MAQPGPAPDMVLSRSRPTSQTNLTSHSRSGSYGDYGTGKGWAASSRTSTDSERSDGSGSDSGDETERHWSENERPPVPTLDPAPAPRRKRTRTPRVKPRYPEGMGPQSRNSELITNMRTPDLPPRPNQEPMRQTTNPFADPVLRPPPPAVIAQASSRKSTLVTLVDGSTGSNASASSSKTMLDDAAKMV